MPLFPRSRPSRGGAETDFALDCTKRLAKALERQGTGRRGQSHTTGQKHFSALVRDNGREVVQTLLDWYLPRIGQPYIPQVDGAAGFNSRFNHIWEVYERDHTQLRIGPEAQAVLDRIKYIDWPEVVAEVIPAICQKSIENYSPFRESMVNLHHTLLQDTGSLCRGDQEHLVLLRRKTLLTHLLTNQMPIPVDFVTDWVMSMPLLGWRWWTQAVYTTGGDRFQKLGRKWTAEYMGEGKWWDSLMQLYREGK